MAEARRRTLDVVRERTEYHENKYFYMGIWLEFH